MKGPRLNPGAISNSRAGIYESELCSALLQSAQTQQVTLRPKTAYLAFAYGRDHRVVPGFLAGIAEHQMEYVGLCGLVTVLHSAILNRT
jgi:hypothetical protein